MRYTHIFKEEKKMYLSILARFFHIPRSYVAFGDFLIAANQTQFKKISLYDYKV